MYCDFNKIDFSLIKNINLSPANLMYTSKQTRASIERVKTTSILVDTCWLK